MEGGGRGCCCGPQAFTSGVLGALACLLVTGGVFLAFHRWDPLWLVVSAVGALLALVGSLLHCCAEQRPTAPPHKGGPPQPLPAMPEQLVPLSNARSVSQLSLNMLPGYFPPVVAAYGIEQHSAVVQNIVGQQQQQRGARLLLLSLPDHTPQASLHSLVAAVYQLDGNVLTDLPSVPENNAPPVASTVQSQPSQPVVKHAEVQTTTAWPSPSQPSTSLNLLDCSAPICDTISPTNQVLIPLRQEDLVSTRAAPDAQPELLERPSCARASSGTTEASTETQVSSTSPASTNTQVFSRSFRTSSTRVPSESRRSSVSTRRSTRSDARRPSAPADMQTPSTSAARSSEPTAREQIPDVPALSVTNETSRVPDIEAPGPSLDPQTALKSSDVPSYSNPMRNETPSTSSDTQCTLNTNAQESVRSSNAQVVQERSGVSNEVPTTVQPSQRTSERGSSDNVVCSIQMPDGSSVVPASPLTRESFENVPVPSEVQVPSDSGTSLDNVTPIHSRVSANEVLVEVPLDIAPSASTSSSSSSVLVDITESETVSATMGLNSDRLLDESLLGAVGGASSELSLSDLDEAELMERSSPPPSYDDVTHERDGSFALAYGTI